MNNVVIRKVANGMVTLSAPLSAFEFSGDGAVTLNVPGLTRLADRDLVQNLRLSTRTENVIGNFSEGPFEEMTLGALLQLCRGGKQSGLLNARGLGEKSKAEILGHLVARQLMGRDEAFALMLEPEHLEKQLAALTRGVNGPANFDLTHVLKLVAQLDAHDRLVLTSCLELHADDAQLAKAENVSGALHKSGYAVSRGGVAGALRRFARLGLCDQVNRSIPHMYNFERCAAALGESLSERLGRIDVPNVPELKETLFRRAYTAMLSGYSAENRAQRLQYAERFFAEVQAAANREAPAAHYPSAYPDYAPMPTFEGLGFITRHGPMLRLTQLGAEFASHFDARRRELEA